MEITEQDLDVAKKTILSLFNGFHMVWKPSEIRDELLPEIPWETGRLALLQLCNSGTLMLHYDLSVTRGLPQ